MTRIRFDHIAIGMSRMVDASEMLVGTLGGVPAYGQPSGVFRWGSWTFEGGGTIEILEPMGDHGFLHRFLGERGPGVHHVTFMVPSLDEVTAREGVGWVVVDDELADRVPRRLRRIGLGGAGASVRAGDRGAGDRKPARWCSSGS